MWGPESWAEDWEAEEDWGYDECIPLGEPLAEPCRNGPHCRFLAIGICRYGHGPEERGEGALGEDGEEAEAPLAEAPAPAAGPPGAPARAAEAAAPRAAPRAAPPAAPRAARGSLPGGGGRWNVLVNPAASRADPRPAAEPRTDGPQSSAAAAARGGGQAGAEGAPRSRDATLNALKATLRKGAREGSGFSWGARGSSRSPRRPRAALAARGGA